MCVSFTFRACAAVLLFSFWPAPAVQRWICTLRLIVLLLGAGMCTSASCRDNKAAWGGRAHASDEVMGRQHSARSHERGFCSGFSLGGVTPPLCCFGLLLAFSFFNLLHNSNCHPWAVEKCTPRRTPARTWSKVQTSATGGKEKRILAGPASSCEFRSAEARFS